MKPTEQILLGTALMTLVACGTPPNAESEAAGSPSETTQSEALSAERVLDLAIAFHDPGGLWEQGRFALDLEESRPDGTVRETSVVLDNGASQYRVRSDFGESVAESVIEGETLVGATLDGTSEFTQEQAEKFRLTPEAALRMRNYYLFLYGLPMKLRDPGTILGPEVQTTTFEDREALELRVSYDPAVGSDIWYFYFDPASYEMFGYRFYHDESAGDGEYIVLEGLAEVDGLRLPAARTWYTHQEDRLLGTDRVVSEGS